MAGRGRGRHHHRRPEGAPAIRNKLERRGFDNYAIAPPDESADELVARGAEPAEAGERWKRIEAAVNAAKAQMDPHGDEADLKETLLAVDMYAGLKRTIRQRYGGQVVTNAWVKMYEMASELDLVRAARVPASEAKGGTLAKAPGPGKTHALRAFCDAELPGAFVCALSHYVCTAFPETQLEWVASSLYPEPEQTATPGERPATGEILGDYYGLYERNEARWLMSPEMRGDVTDVRDVRALAARAREKLGAVDLYTSDAGIEVSSDYGRQEEMTARINFGQTLVGLMALRPGGALVVKTYTFVHPFSQSLIGVCAALFERFSVVKPLSSRSANSEVYLVGLGFRGLGAGAEEGLLKALEHFAFGRPLAELGAATAASLYLAGRQIHEKQQVEFLNEALGFFAAYRGRTGELREALRGAARRAQEAWLARHPVRPLADSCRIPAAPAEEAAAARR
jgi:cap2 methyltransferase